MNLVGPKHQVFLESNQEVYPVSLPCLKSPNISPIEEKQALLEKIKTKKLKNEELEAKNHALLNTISDLKILLQTCYSENDSDVKQIEEENAVLKDKSLRISAGLKSVYQNGKHFDNCALFWREFLQ